MSAADDTTAPPALQIKRVHGQLGLCLSRTMKWAAGIAATLVTTALIAMVSLEINNTIMLASMAEQNNARDARISDNSRRIAANEVVAKRASESRFTREDSKDHLRRIERLEGKHGL